MRMLVYLLLWALSAAVAMAAQPIYKCTEADGTIVYSEQPCSTDATRVETIETTGAEETGTRDALAEQSEFVRMNDVRRQCDTRIDSIGARYAAQYRRIAQEIADVQERIRTLDYRIRGGTHETELRAQIPILETQREDVKATEASELSAARAQCQRETEEEEKRQLEAQKARANAQRAAEVAAAERAAEEKAKLDKDAAADER